MFWLFGLAMSGAIAVAVSKSLVENHGRRIIPMICVAALAFGLILGWALTEFIAYVQLTEVTRH